MFWILLVTLTVLGLMILAVRADFYEAVREETIQPAGQCTPSRNAITHTAYPSKRLRWRELERHLQEREITHRG